MSPYRWMLIPVFSATLLFTGHSSAEREAQDSIGELPLCQCPGREEILYTCQACHSLAIIKQQGLGHSSWEETLEWMVEEQGLPEPDAKRRKKILDYLSSHFGPDGYPH